MATLKLNDAALAELLTGPTGPVYKTTRLFAEEVTEAARRLAPLGFDQGGRRAIGLLKADMSIRSENLTPGRIEFTVGTDPENPKDGYHYAYVVHQGRAGFASTGGIMRFMTRDGNWRRELDVGPAEAQPFLYEAVREVNATFPVKFVLVETP